MTHEPIALPFPRMIVPFLSAPAQTATPRRASLSDRLRQSRRFDCHVFSPSSPFRPGWNEDDPIWRVLHLFVSHHFASRRSSASLHRHVKACEFHGQEMVPVLIDKRPHCGLSPTRTRRTHDLRARPVKLNAKCYSTPLRRYQSSTRFSNDGPTF